MGIVAREPREPRLPGEPRDPRDLRQPGDIRDPRDLRQPGDPRDPNGSRTERSIHRVLGIFFTLLGLVVSIDLLHLTFQFQSQHDVLISQIDCNEKQSDALVTIGKARRDVDSAALFYDQTLQVFLATPVNQREPEDPAVQNLSRSLDLLVEARKRAVSAYELSPFPDCHS